jgi:23S rRNA pseudouridine2605 synthase
VYEAEVDGRVRPGELARWRQGAELDDGPAVPAAVEIIAHGPRTTALRLVFREGRKHEIKRYCRALGHPVRRLVRTAFGPLSLGDLRPGGHRRLTGRELAALRRLTRAPRRSGDR